MDFFEWFGLCELRKDILQKIHKLEQALWKMLEMPMTIWQCNHEKNLCCKPFKESIKTVKYNFLKHPKTFLQTKPTACPEIIIQH